MATGKKGLLKTVFLGRTLAYGSPLDWLSYGLLKVVSDLLLFSERSWQFNTVAESSAAIDFVLLCLFQLFNEIHSNVMQVTWGIFVGARKWDGYFKIKTK